MLALACRETPEAPPPADPASGAHTDVEKARAVLLDDPARAKFFLYDRLSDHPGTAEEYRILREACRAPEAFDQACIDACTKKLDAINRDAGP